MMGLRYILAPTISRIMINLMLLPFVPRQTDFSGSMEAGVDAAVAALATEEATAAECLRLLERSAAERRQREDAAAAAAQEGLRLAGLWQECVP
jgi:hypothetical protein